MHLLGAGLLSLLFEGMGQPILLPAAGIGNEKWDNSIICEQKNKKRCSSYIRMVPMLECLVFWRCIHILLSYTT
jgi:hypothetical protein